MSFYNLVPTAHLQNNLFEFQYQHYQKVSNNNVSHEENSNQSDVQNEDESIASVGESLIYSHEIDSLS